MNVQDWLNNPKTIQKSKKSYAHFDHRIDIYKAAEFIQNPQNIVNHGFYPFIHYTMTMNKYNKKLGKQVKKREICYPAHLDRCIYQYYGFVLNEYYNERIKNDGIEKVPVAYRTDLKDSNIQSAKKAFDFLKNNPNSYVMIGDFTEFFENFDHKYLKQQWCDLLGVSKLPDDHYAVYKNITKYSIWELDDLLKRNKVNNIRELNQKAIVLPKEEYKLNRNQIKKHKVSYGIPQGSPISAVLANVYMLDADRLIYQKVKQYNGLYMRYSDDFIIILPKQEDYKVFEEIIEIIKTIPNLKLENKQTQFFKVDLPVISNISKCFAVDADDSQKRINFLGFSYDGNKIYIRPKTTGKYYYRMIRKAKGIAKNKDFKGADKLYMIYSERGAKGKRADGKTGNFFTYIERVENEFGENEMIHQDVKRHISKIRKSLKKMKKRRMEKVRKEWQKQKIIITSN